MIRRRPTITTQRRIERKLNFRLILEMSRCYGAAYDGESLPHHRRIWPARTFLQTRLAEIRRDNQHVSR